MKTKQTNEIKIIARYTLSFFFDDVFSSIFIRINNGLFRINSIWQEEKKKNNNDNGNSLDSNLNSSSTSIDNNTRYHSSSDDYDNWSSSSSNKETK